jgi:hypothetical protein
MLLLDLIDELLPVVPVSAWHPTASARTRHATMERMDSLHTHPALFFYSITRKISLALAQLSLGTHIELRVLSLSPSRVGAQGVNSCVMK